MPTLLIQESEHSHSGRKGQVELPLFDESGELMLAGQVIADFLESADFSAVFEHAAVQPYIVTVVDEDDASIEEQILPGSIVKRVMDEDDLAGMFVHYLDLLGENALAEDANVEDKAKLAVFENALLKPLNERFKRGAFRKMRSAEGGARGRNSQVNMMLGAMMAKGEIKRAKKPGGGYKGGDYEKGGKYRSGPTKATATKAKQIGKRMKAKNVRARLSASRKRASRRGRALAASVGMEEAFLFGFGEPYGGALFTVGTIPEARIEFTEAEFDALKKSFAPCYEAMPFMKKKKGDCGSDDDEEEPDADDDAEEGTNESLSQLDRAPFAGSAGSPTLSESANIAARVGNVMGFARKPEKVLDEAKK